MEKGTILLVVLLFLAIFLGMKATGKEADEEMIAAVEPISVSDQMERDTKIKYEMWAEKHEEEREEKSKPSYRIDASQADIDLMARVVMSEASILDGDAKQAVATVIVNRVLDAEFPNTIKEVCEQPYQFSTQDNGTPDFDCYLAVQSALMFEVFPKDMLWFRLDHVDYGYQYYKNGNTYFSTRKDYNE